MHKLTHRNAISFSEKFIVLSSEVNLKKNQQIFSLFIGLIIQLVFLGGMCYMIALVFVCLLNFGFGFVKNESSL